MKRLAPLALLSLLALSPAAVHSADKVTLEGLLRQMTDLSLLAEFPDPPYVTRQFSSYDRASVAPGEASWFANADRGFMLYDGTIKDKTPYFKGGPMQGRSPDGHFAAGTRVGLAPTHKPIGDYVWAYATAPDGGTIDGKIPQGYIEKSAITMDPQGHVLAEMDGPGCVVRVWSANPNEAGKVRIYLDEAKGPVIEAPLQDLMGGNWQTETDGKKWTPFPDPIACERSRGFNLYFPISYAKHCKITVDKPDIYYHVDYRTYPKGTEVETLSHGALAKASEQLHSVKERCQLPVRRQATGVLATRGDVRHLKPDEEMQLTLEGPGAITCLTVDGKDADEAEALRSLVLIGTFDGADRPQIWCPVGDFFASSPGLNPYHSLPFDVSRSGDGPYLQAWWPMPFQKLADCKIRNLGRKEFRVGLHVVVSTYPWTDRSMHFHAKWRTETMKTRPFRDWTYCDLKGQGVFVGDMLSVFNPSPAWWGEGDEKVYVDGEKFPSWFGTGSEDYYAYAWGDSRPYQHAYHNQTRCDGPGSRGHTSVNRFHVLDAIPFTKSLRFDMEVWHWAPNIDVTYAATSYWYAKPGASDDFKEVDPKVLQTIPQLPPPFKVDDALEGEKLKILGKSGNFEAGPQGMAEFADGKWSGGSHLWVRPPRKGEWVDLELPVAADGKYHVVVYLTKARDYGVLQFSLDGKPLGKPVDCFHADTVVSTGPVDLGEVELKKGTATLRGEVVGTNEKSDGLRYMWGLDCVVLKPAGP
jgi:hypothetical protein